MHDFYKDRKVSTLQKELFLKDYFPEYVMNPQEAQYEFMRAHGELVDLADAEGRTALEGALPYPPGVLCVHPGEKWSKPLSPISWTWWKASTSCPALLLKSRAFMYSPALMERNMPMAMC